MTPSNFNGLPLPVLIVEDEAMIRLDLVLAFETAGFAVREAATAEEAIELLETGAMVSAVITDLRVPGRVDGRGLVAWVRKHRPRLPVIVASGYAFELEDDPSLAVAAIVHKPYDADEVLATLSRVSMP